MISLVKYVVIPAIKNNYGIYLLFPCLFGGMPPNKQGKTYIPCCQFLCIRSYEFLCSLIYRLHFLFMSLFCNSAPIKTTSISTLVYPTISTSNQSTISNKPKSSRIHGGT